MAEHPPRVHKASRQARAAFASDNAWFRDNPERSRLRRKIKPGELPRRLRKRGVAEVLIERASPSTFVRTWLDVNGRTIGSGADFYNEEIVPGAVARAISVRQDGLCMADHADIGAIDREWFRAHPGEQSYTRPMLPSEIVTVSTPPGTQCCGGMVRVTRWDELLRCREVVEMRIAPLGAAQ
jgi:hypothetical protein